MPCRAQPRCIIQRTATHTDHAIPWRAADPGAALGANQSGVYTPAIGDALQLTRLNPAEPESSVGHDDPDRESTAGQALTIGAVAGIDQLRRFRDFVSD